MGIVRQRCWFVQQWVESRFPPLFPPICHLLLLPFSFFHIRNGVSCAVKRYNFLCLQTSPSRRGTKRKSSGHKHSGKFTSSPLNLIENKFVSLGLFLLQQKQPLCSLERQRGCAVREVDITCLRTEHPKCPRDPQELRRTTSRIRTGKGKPSLPGTLW